MRNSKENLFHFSDDLLNYEIGDIDDNDLTGADEDELLLSDDGTFSMRIIFFSLQYVCLTLYLSILFTEIFPEKLSQEEEENLLSETEKKTNKENVEKVKKVENSDSAIEPVTIQQTQSAASEKSITKLEIVADTCENEAKNVENIEIIASAPDLHSEQEEIINENEQNVTEQYSNQVEQNKVDDEKEETEETTVSTENSTQNNLGESEENVVETDDNKHDSTNDTENEKNTFESQATTLSSQISTEDSSFNNSMRVDMTEFDADDSDEVSERQNRRLCSERDPQPPPPQLEHNRSSHHHQFPRGPRALMPPGRHRFPGPNMQYRVPLGEILRQPGYNQVPPPPGQQSNVMNRHPMPPRMEFLPGHTIGVMRPFIRLPMRPGMPLPPNQGRLPLPPGSVPMQQQPRLQGPPFQGPVNPNRPPYPPYSNSGIPPNQLPPGAIRMQQQQQQQQRFLGRPPNAMPPNSHPSNFIVQRTPLPHQMMHNANVGPGQLAVSNVPPQPIGRKVLLNPNFKGGVQAATSKYKKIKKKNPKLFEITN